MEDLMLKIVFTHLLIALVGIAVGWVMAIVYANIRHQRELNRIWREMLEYERQLAERMQGAVDDMLELPRPKIM